MYVMYYFIHIYLRRSQILLTFNRLQLMYSDTVCYYYVTYAFQGESTLHSCLNVKELLAQNRRDI